MHSYCDITVNAIRLLNESERDVCASALSHAKSNFRDSICERLHADASRDAIFLLDGYIICRKCKASSFKYKIHLGSIPGAE